MKILLLMQWFDPEPQIKGLAFAKKLRDLGNEVEVLTGFPNYPGGILYQGYSVKLLQIEMIDGIRIMRVPLYPSHDTSPLRRILNYVSFGFSSFLAGLLFVKRPDVIYACGPPVTVGVGAALISFLRRIPLVYDVQDLWPDSLLSTGMFKSTLGAKTIGYVCKWVYVRAAHITVQSPGVRDCLLFRGVPEEKVSVIYNWCDETNIKSSLSTKNQLIQSIDDHLGSFNVLFAGNLGKAQDLDTIVEAANLLKNENSAVRIFLLGGGIEVPRLKKNIYIENITNISILPPVPMSEVGKFLASSDALLVHLKDCPLFRITIPAKVQAYMAAGKPILMAVAGDASRLITKSEAGMCSLPSNARSIADAINTLATSHSSLLKKMGENGQAYYWANMSMDVGVQRFLEIFKIVLKVKNSHV